jgi:HEAT repeat protein
MSEARKASFKKGIDVKSNRRHRNELAVSIRKAKKDQGLAKRRPKYIDVQSRGKLEPRGIDPGLGNLARYVAGINGEDPAIKTEAVRAIRKLLSDETNPPVREVIEAGIIPRLIQFLAIDEPILQFEAAWALTNVASSEYTRIIVEHGAVPMLVRLMNHASNDVREQSAWCLGNIAGDCPELRDHVIECDALQYMLANAQQPASPTMLRTVTWAISNLCRGKPAPVAEKIFPALAVLVQLLASSQDEEVLADAGWAVSYLSDGSNEKIEACLQAGLVPTMIRLMGHTALSVVVPALRTLGNIVSGTEGQTQAVLDSGGLQVLIPHLHSQRAGIRKETCWALSNVAAGTQAQMANLLAFPLLLEGVIEQLRSGPWDVKKEAAWTVVNIATAGNPAQLQQLATAGAVGPLCEVLEVDDVRAVKMALEGLEAMLRQDTENGRNDYAVHVEEVGGLDKLENLQEHHNTEIYEFAVNLIETYYGADEDECENIAPAVSENAQTFAFGALPVVPGLIKQASNPGVFDFRTVAAAQ